MKLKRPLYGPHHERGPSRGRDVRDFVKRTLHRLPAQIPVGENFFPKPPGGFDDVYNRKTVEAIRVVQMFNGITPTTGNMGQATLNALWQYADAYSKWVYRLWPPPKPPVELVEPRQGWASLHSSLWELYSIGRQEPYDFSDLGTYNPASRLPSGAPSDHAILPAYAFDLGIEPDTGWQNLEAREYFNLCTKRPEVEYVILGDRIWSRSRGLHSYSGGGHLNHLHISGVR